MSKVPLLARCLTLTRHFPAAHVLYRLSYWQPRTKVTHGGFLWTVRSISELMVETGLSTQQVKDAFERLRAAHLVVTERHLFGSKLASYHRLTERAQVMLAGHEDAPQGVQTTLTSEVQMTLSSEGQTTLSIKKGDYTGSLNKEFKTCVVTDASIPEGHMNKGFEGEESMGKTAAEVLAGLSASKALEKLHAPEKPNQFASVWKKLVSSQYQVFVPTFTAKQLGQAKNMMLKCPPDLLLPMLQTCLTNWVGFCELAQKNSGKKGFPNLPNIDYMNAHLASAIEYASTSNAAKPAKVYVPPPSLAPKNEYMPQVDMPSSMDEILAKPDK